MELTFVSCRWFPICILIPFCSVLVSYNLSFKLSSQPLVIYRVAEGGFFQELLVLVAKCGPEHPSDLRYAPVFHVLVARARLLGPEVDNFSVLTPVEPLELLQGVDFDIPLGIRFRFKVPFLYRNNAQLPLDKLRMIKVLVLWRPSSYILKGEYIPPALEYFGDEFVFHCLLYTSDAADE